MSLYYNLSKRWEGFREQVGDDTNSSALLSAIMFGKLLLSAGPNWHLTSPECVTQRYIDQIMVRSHALFQIWNGTCSCHFGTLIWDIILGIYFGTLFCDQNLFWFLTETICFGPIHTLILPQLILYNFLINAFFWGQLEHLTFTTDRKIISHVVKNHLFGKFIYYVLSYCIKDMLIIQTLLWFYSIKNETW